MSVDAGGWTENRPTRGARALAPAELWAYRELIGFLALRDVKARYKQSAFGLGWAILQPVATVAVFTIVFRQVADVPSDGLPYLAFALAGVSLWSYFSSSVSSATGSLVGNASLVTKVYFPRLAVPVSALVHGLVDLAVALVLLGGLMVYYGLVPGLAVLVVPLCIAAVMAVALGVGLLLATLNVRYRDVHHLFGLLTQLWLFASPVAYPSSLVPAGWRWAYALNPMAGAIDTFRWAVLGGPSPGPYVLVSAATGAVLVLVGLRYFAHAERQFADVI